MIHPVLTRYGHSFERSAIVAWISSSGGDVSKCPLTRMSLCLHDIIDDKALKFHITKWYEQKNENKWIRFLKRSNSLGFEAPPVVRLTIRVD
jgi:U-box domain